MLDFLWAIPLAKLIYSAVLLGVVLILVREIYTIWADRSYYVGNFAYYTDGKSEEDQSKKFAVSVMAHHHMLRSALADEKRQADMNAKLGTLLFLPQKEHSLTQWKSPISDLELKVQGFDIGKLLSQLRAWISPPVEITGYVTKIGTIVRASVNMPVQAFESSELIPPQFETGPLANDASAAFAIAASVVWLQEATQTFSLANVERDTFVAWMLAWWEYRAIRDRLGSAPLTEEEKKRWQQARSMVEKLIPKAPRYPDIWRLRADIIEAAPSDQQTQEERDRAKQDRERYAAVVVGAQPTVAASVPPTDVSRQGPVTKTDDITVRPGRVLWARKPSGGADFALTTTAVVLVGAGNDDRRVLLPDYAIPPGKGEEVEFRLGPSGPVIARATPADVLLPKAAGGERRGVVLARLESSTPSSNEAVIGDLPPTKLTQVAAPPAPGDNVVLLSSRGRVTGSLKAVSSLFAETTARISAPGDAGAPVVNAQGQLLAMGYLGGDASSSFLLLRNIFVEGQLRLAP